MSMSDDTNPMREAIQNAISENRVILFMKGTP
ncbi:MAG: monothiol glutaredoxin, Grx4 family, partial [Solirubrobacterales bacterium]|nr:monothiol glutaredoxin, Grx4 family [Solirubrobacterales bacterium]